MQEIDRYLQELLHTEIPLTRQMGVRVASCDTGELVLAADLGPNINIHGTAFGGSLYSICALTCWGLLHLQLRAETLAPLIVLAQGEIKYLRPVDEEIRVHCRMADPDLFSHFCERIREGRKSAILLHAEVILDTRVCARFSGHYSTAR